jgi:hypothetical protein
MTRNTRRHFLKFASSALATLGINQFLFQQKAEQAGKVLAQSTPRKLALLVGINQYASSPLEGCVNDLELQRNLLIHRFRFNPKDILVLADEAATRTGILTAFEEHLIKQAKPGDVVFYHYSGHGSQIFDPNPIVVVPNQEGLNGTFVPVNSNLPAGYPDVGGTVEDIMGHTLFLLMSALKTENVTVVLDSCFSGGATRDSRIRSRNAGKKVLVSSDEKTYQQQWLSRLNMSPEQFVKGYRTGVAKGVVLAATDPEQLALEVNINGFKSGIFTYLLTHYLWREDQKIDRLFTKIVSEIPKNFKQKPGYEVKPGTQDQEKPIYFINSPNSTAQAVVTKVNGDTAQLWLGGVDLSKVETKTVFTAVKGNGQVRVLSREGIVAQAKIEKPVTESTLLRLSV